MKESIKSLTDKRIIVQATMCGKVINSVACYFTEADTNPLTASKSVGRDKDGNLLGTDYPYLWSYGVGVPSPE